MKNPVKQLILTVTVSLIAVHCGNEVPELKFSFAPTSALPDTIWSGWPQEHENRYYVLDHQQMMIWKLSHDYEVIEGMQMQKGQGPGEIIEPAWLSFCKNGIFLLDWGLRRITRFDTAMHFDYAFNIPFGRGTRMNIHKDTLYILAGEMSSNKLLHRYDLKGSRIDSAIPFFENPELAHLSGEKRQGLGDFFTPADWAFQGDTIWVSNTARYQISAYLGNNKVAEILGDDDLVTPPVLQQMGNGIGLTVQGSTRLLYFKNKLLVYHSYLATSMYDPERKFKNTLHLYTLQPQELLAESTWIQNPDDEWPLVPGYSKNGVLYAYRHPERFTVEIIIQ